MGSLGVMGYAFARICAVIARHVDDYYTEGKRWWRRPREKAANVTRCRRTTSSRRSGLEIVGVSELMRDAVHQLAEAKERVMAQRESGADP
jgi:hypothetical protein